MSWDIGDPEPEGAQTLQDYTADDQDGDDSPFWNKTYQGGWKGYKNGFKVYLEWDELVRQWGPVTMP